MRKVPVLHMIGLLGPILLAPLAFADAGGDLKQAEALCEAGQYAQAEAIYKQIVQGSPGTEMDLAARKGLAMLYVKTGKEPLLIRTYEGLVADFKDHQDTRAILREIGDACRNANRFDVAVPIYEYIAEHWPKDENAVLAMANLVACRLCLKDDAAAEGAFQKLRTDYGSHPDFRRAVHTIGDNLRWRNINAEAARQMYSLAASGDPYPDMIWAQMGLAISCIRLKDFEAAGAVVESIAADFGSDDRIGQALCHTADAYRDHRLHAEARRLYQYVIDRYPQSEYAMWSQAGLAISALDAKDESLAQAAIERLGARYAGRADFAAAVCVVADHHRWREKYARARELYALAAAVAPDHRQGIWFQMGLAISSVCVNDANTAEAAVARLQSRYRNDPGLAQALYEVGATFSNARQYDKATEPFNHVIATWPDSDYAMLSKVGLGLIQVRQGDDAGGEAIFQKVLADHKGHPRLAEAAHLMAEAYFRRAMALEQAEAKLIGSAKYAEIVRQHRQPEAVKDYYERAIDKWRMIIEEPPSTPYYAVRAWYFTGVVYRRHLGDPHKALSYYEKVANAWPDYEYAWSAQSMVAQCCEALSRSGEIEKAEAQTRIEQAYRAVVDRYADCPLAQQAHLKLARLFFAKGQWQEAAHYLEQYVGRYPDARQWRQALIYLGTTYERMGNTGAAAELYRVYLGLTDPADRHVEIIEKRLQGLKESER